MKIDVRADIRSAQKFLKLTQSGVRKAAARAINDTLITVRKDGAQLIKDAHPALKISDIKRAMDMRRATARNLEGRIGTTGKPLSLKLFGATQTKRGVSARMGAARKGLVFYRGRKAFIIKPYQDEIFVKRENGGVRRYRGPSLPGVFRAQQKRMLAIIKARWPKTFKSRLDYEIAQASRKAVTR